MAFACAVERGFDADVASFDLGRGALAYKMGFATGVRCGHADVRRFHPARPLVCAAIVARRIVRAMPAERVAVARSRLGALRRSSRVLVRPPR